VPIVVLVAATPKFAAQASQDRRNRMEAATIISNVSASISGVLEPAGREN
jgi:hypothetical protein